jgi:hypothetical protein
MATPRPVLITVNGTGVPDPFGPGFSGDIGRAFAVDPWQVIENNMDGIITPTPPVEWQPIGYPAAVFPMNPSVVAGRAEVNRQIGLRPAGTPLFLSGYSQGAIVTAEVWSQDILSPSGIHHDRLPDVRGIIQFGDPVRCPGIAHGNEIAGFPAPKDLDGVVSGGIAGPTCLTEAQTPSFYLSCALDGDLYAAAPVGPKSGTAVVDTGAPWHNEPLVGQIETRIYGFIESGSLAKGFMAIVEGIVQEFEYPLTNTIALVHAIFNGIGFAAKGMNAPHWRYGPFVPPMINWILEQI